MGHPITYINSFFNYDLIVVFEKTAEQNLMKASP